VWQTKISEDILPMAAGNSSVSIHENEGNAFIFRAEIPAFAAVIAFSTVIFVLAVQGIYGAMKRIRSSIFAFVSLGMVAVVCQIVPLAVLLSQVFPSEENWKESIVALSSIALFIASVVIIFFFTLIWGLFCVDPGGKSIYEEDLTLCGPHNVTCFVDSACVVAALLAVPVVVASFNFYFGTVDPDGDEFPFSDTQFIDVYVLGMGSAGALVFLSSFGGCYGVHTHNFYVLCSFMVCQILGELTQVAFAVALLVKTTQLRVNLANAGELVDRDSLGQILLLSTLTFLAAVLQYGATFIIGVILIADRDSVYVADYV